MTQLKDIEKKFEGIFAGAFPEGTSLEEKVKIVNEFRRELKAYKRHTAKESLEEDEVKIITRLNLLQKRGNGYKIGGIARE